MTTIRRMRLALLIAKQHRVPSNDPMRDPNWCFMHNMMWPACQDQH